MEYIDIVDEQGIPTGETIERSIAHSKGIRHRTAHIGMTATPKETKYQSSIGYFGEPVYTYSLKNGIEDGFLAPFKVINITTNIGDEWRPTKGQKDMYGNEIEDRIYNNSDYDYNIVIEDRIREVAQEITNYLKSTDRMAKTIVFCAAIGRSP